MKKLPCFFAILKNISFAASKVLQGNNKQSFYLTYKKKIYIKK